MVATSHAQCIRLGTPQAEFFLPVWPSNDDCTEVWRVGTIESTRREHGLHETESLFAVDARAGTMRLVGEVNKHGDLTAIDCCELVVVWKAPTELRGLVPPGLVQDVVAAMRAQMREANWSMLTAARAAFQDAAIAVGEGMEAIEACWTVAPICTSVAIICWQRCLLHAARAQGRGDSGAVELILRWMPLKADRALPSDLVCTLIATGWSLLEKVGDSDPLYRSKFIELLASPACDRFQVQPGQTVSL